MSKLNRTFVKIINEIGEKHPNDKKKCSVQEVIDRVMVIPTRIEVLLREKIIKGRVVSGVSYIVGETIESIRLKSEDFDKKNIEFMQKELDSIKMGDYNE